MLLQIILINNKIQLANFALENIAMSNNKLNAADCGPEMTISGDGLILKYGRNNSPSDDGRK